MLTSSLTSRASILQIAKLLRGLFTAGRVAGREHDAVSLLAALRAV